MSPLSGGPADGAVIRFVGEKIAVQMTQEPGFKKPVSLTMKGTTYTVREVRTMWEDHGFGGAPQRSPRWWQRHHRVYYIVETTAGEVFEIYWDRGSKDKQQWFLTKQIR